MLGMLPVLGVHAFEKAQRFAVAPTAEAFATSAPEPVEMLTPNAPLVSAPVELVCQGKGYEAHGSDTAQGFLVFAGSTATSEIGSSISFSQRKLREDLLKNGVLEVDGTVLRFTLDYVFSSPSTAASLIHGRSANGRIEWKDSNGKTLKAQQEAEAAQ